MINNMLIILIIIFIGCGDSNPNKPQDINNNRYKQ